MCCERQVTTCSHTLKRRPCAVYAVRGLITGAIFSRFPRGETEQESARAPTHGCSATGERGCPEQPGPLRDLCRAPLPVPSASSRGCTAQPPHLPPSQTKCLKRNKPCQRLMNAFAGVCAQPLWTFCESEDEPGHE